MRDLIKTIIFGLVFFCVSAVYAADYKVLILPDNIVTENASVDSFIYDAASEFFADGIINLLNTTDNIQSQTVSEVRDILKKDPAAMLAAKSLTTRFKTSYNTDYTIIKKLAQRTGNRYVLLLTSTIDAENYILRRTWWDFFNVPGASVVDPAYKISTYAVLIDTQNNKRVWSDTYYKTISVVENRIITRGYSPQTEQLEKIRDYSRYLCPQIAQCVQRNILPPDVLASDSNQIDYNMGNIDNVFTKKYRHWGKETNKFYKEKKNQTEGLIDKTKTKYNNYKQKRQETKKTKLEVKAQPVYSDSDLTKINVIKKNVKPSKTNYVLDDESLFEPIEIKKTRKNNLFGNYDSDRPRLRDYESY